jgi:hypothetical protein
MDERRVTGKERKRFKRELKRRAKGKGIGMCGEDRLGGLGEAGVEAACSVGGYC